MGKTRGKIMLEQLSRPRFFPGFENSRPFFPLARRKEWEISKPGKNQVLESCSNIFFPLIRLRVSLTKELIAHEPLS